MPIVSNLDFAHWTEGSGQERMTAALLDRLVYPSTILFLEAQGYRIWTTQDLCNG